MRPKRTRVATDKLAGKEAVAWDLKEPIKVQRNDVRCTKDKLKYKDMAKKDKRQEEQQKQQEELQVRLHELEEQVAEAESQKAKAESQLAEMEDKNLRMMAEFDNYRKRTNKEKIELTERAGEKIFTEMLPLIDDFERGIANLTPSLSQGEGGEAQYEAVVSGMKLIYQKFLSFLDKQGVHAVETENADFNTDEHEAVTTFAAGEDKKGKVIDCTQKGYKMGEKVIRFAKVVVGE